MSINETKARTQLMQGTKDKGIRTMKSTPMSNIVQLHEEHNLQEMHKQCKTSKDFMKMCMYSVPLDSLYRILASCQYRQDAEFCPVLVQIIDE